MDELKQFRVWFQQFDWAVWDAQVAADAKAGRLDALADKALDDHAGRKTTPL